MPGARDRHAAASSGRTSSCRPTCVIGDNVKIQNNVSSLRQAWCSRTTCSAGRRWSSPTSSTRAATSRASTSIRETLVRRGATIGANATDRLRCTPWAATLRRRGRRGDARRARLRPRAWARPPGSRGWICECGIKIATGGIPPTPLLRHLRDGIRRRQAGSGQDIGCLIRSSNSFGSSTIPVRAPSRVCHHRLTSNDDTRVGRTITLMARPLIARLRTRRTRCEWSGVVTTMTERIWRKIRAPIGKNVAFGFAAIDRDGNSLAVSHPKSIEHPNPDRGPVFRLEA